MKRTLEDFRNKLLAVQTASDLEWRANDPACAGMQIVAGLLQQKSMRRNQPYENEH
jgi:hypothetical protein